LFCPNTALNLISSRVNNTSDRQEIQIVFIPYRFQLQYMLTQREKSASCL